MACQFGNWKLKSRSSQKSYRDPLRLSTNGTFHLGVCRKIKTDSDLAIRQWFA